jgi:hypothetical protein
VLTGGRSSGARCHNEPTDIAPKGARYPLVALVYKHAAPPEQVQMSQVIFLRMKFSAQRRFAKLSVGLIAGVVICVFVQGNRAQSNGSLKTLTQPYSLREDFQHEGLGQWASYPPAQDIGYEPSLSPTRDYGAPDGR